jgi:DNA replication factor GINS
LDYRTLYEAWKREQDHSELQPLGKEFYKEASALVRAQKDEAQMLDEKSLHAQLFAQEQDRTGRLLAGLAELRFRKLSRATLSGEQPSVELLTSEEESMTADLASAKSALDSLLKAVLGGRTPHGEAQVIDRRPKKTMVRFLQNLPAIVGANAQVYGPFKAEDVATLPEENAESLIKRGIALRVEAE